MFPNWGGFSAAPLEPASYQFSCRDKKIAPGGICAETLTKIWNTRTVFHLGAMRASPPTDFYEGFLNWDIFLALIRLALAGDVRATFPEGEGFGIRIATPVCGLVRNDMFFR